MNRTKLLVVATAFLSMTAFAADPPAQAPAPSKSQAKNQTKELTRAEFEALLAHPDKLLILDVRRPDELTRIGGFPVYLSVQIKEIENSLAWIPKDRTIVTVSNHATRSGRAADFLASKGYKVAGTVGAQTFEEQGGRLTKFEVPPPRNGAAPAAASAGSAAAPAGATRQ
jgi:rhodanese-related sulfurtransferase